VITTSNPTMSLFGNHPGKRLGCSHPIIPSHQDLENYWQQHNSHLPRCNPYIVSIWRSIFPLRWVINAGLCHKYPRRYPIKYFND
jgi:hypothetical protein